MMKPAALYAIVLGVSALKAGAGFNLCIESFEVPEIVVIPERFPVGCEVIDCCPGCPGPGELEWRILVSAPPQLQAALRFSNLGGPAKGMQIQGAADWAPDETLALKAGETTLKGFKLMAGKRPPVASLTWKLGKGFKPSKDSPAPEGDILIEGRIGKFVVSRVRRGVRFFPCPRPSTEDRIRLRNNAGADQAVILLDGRRSGGCVNDEVQRASTETGVGNLLTKDICAREEAIVFSDDDAMQLKENLTTWTNSAGDVLTVDQTPDLVNAPLHFWVMRGTFANTSTRINNDLARANQLYNAMNCGTRFSSAAIHDAVADPQTAGLLNAACGSAAQLRSDIGFTAGALNVYYLNDPGARGWWCGNNTIIIGSGADNESLAHEIGHSFTLDHTNGVADMSATNLMITGGLNRDNITEGQCFRCNANATSTLNANGNRTGPTRSCPDATTNDGCPALSLDINPN